MRLRVAETVGPIGTLLCSTLKGVRFSALGTHTTTIRHSNAPLAFCRVDYADSTSTPEPEPCERCVRTFKRDVGVLRDVLRKVDHVSCLVLRT